MASFGFYKLTDAIRYLRHTVGPGGGGKPVSTQATTAEQAREACESDAAGKSGPSARDHMVDIGRGNQQSGRQGQ